MTNFIPGHVLMYASAFTCMAFRPSRPHHVAYYAGGVVDAVEFGVKGEGGLETVVNSGPTVAP